MVNALAADRADDTVGRAYAACERLAREHYENFPVASIVLPKRMRPAIAAIYAFARRADDFADEPGYHDDERLRLLDEWGRRLRECVSWRPASRSAEDLIFVALADTIRVHDLPLSLFEDLLSAFRQDVTVERYRTWNDVLDYCARSANPVGRLVLRVAGYRDAELDRASDAVCTALQLTNFWQDFARDWANGRLYVPLADRDRVGARDADLDAGRLSPEWRVALRDVSARTRELFTAGRPVCDGVSGRLKLELRLTWLGGTRILEKLGRVDYDVFQHRPALSAADAAPLVWRAVTWKAV
ncbi:MAG: squalene synthase HpnC [Burkholderiales bacterium]